MADLSCKYLGLELKNPLVVGSSGLTSSLDNLRTIANMGAGAVVLKSIFEEQIRFEADKLLQSDNTEIKSWRETFQDIVSSREHYYEEAYSYITGYAKEHTLRKYLTLISEAKESLDIPVIASINCSSKSDWQYFAKRIQDAGADALELNVYLLPSDFEKAGIENEQVYFDIIKEVQKFISIPLSLKIGYYFSGLAHIALRLSESGISGLTLFNRPYNPDIDIENLQVSSSNLFSSESEYFHTLRWVALLSGRISCDIAASTGIHGHETIIKQLLAGADAVHMVSVFYRHHFDIIPKMLEGINEWMDRHNFSTVREFKGLLGRKNIINPATFERVQFIRLFSGIE